MKVLFFSSLIEITGTAEEEIRDFSSVQKLKNEMEKKFPGIKEIKYTIAVNRKIVHDDSSLKLDDEVAFLPPFSGG